MAKDMTWPEAIVKVLEQHPSGLHYKDITEEIHKQNLKTHSGATPALTVNALIAASIKKSSNDSPYVRIGPGIFALKSTLAPDVAQSLAKTSAKEIEKDEADAPIVTGFGMYWQREAVYWKSQAQIWGIQQSKKIDFGQQCGIYMLHDGREVIYVGRTVRPLGQRLFEHTQGRMAFRWDRFSWFGLRPIHPEDGSFGELPKSFSAENLIATLEALMIEAMEPRLNRRRGDKDFEAVEFEQYVDPKVMKKKLVVAAFDTDE